MKRQVVTSSNVVSIGYEDKVLEIEFKSGVYRYLNVPPAVYEAVMGAESLGQAINKNVKGFFEFDKVA
jgi:hypothetical protein